MAVEFGLMWFFLLLLLLPVCKLPVSTCDRRYPLHIPYEYYQAGDLIIGGMASQLIAMFEPMSFVEHPDTKLIDETV